MQKAIQIFDKLQDSEQFVSKVIIPPQLTNMVLKVVQNRIRQKEVSMRIHITMNRRKDVQSALGDGFDLSTRSSGEKTCGAR